MQKHSMCKKCPYSELFWSVFSPNRTEYGEIDGRMWTRITPNTDTFNVVILETLIHFCLGIRLKVCNLLSRLLIDPRTYNGKKNIEFWTSNFEL